MNRRNFLTSVSAATGGLLFAESVFANGMNYIATQKPQVAVASNDFRSHFNLRPGLKNFNNGVSPALNVCVQKYNEMMQFSSAFPMQNEPTMWDMATAAKTKLATLLGTSSENLAMLRSTTEAMQTVISGLDLNAGDEIVISSYEYPSLVEAVELKKLRNGIDIKVLDFSVFARDEQIISAYTKSITPKTKLLVVSHVCYKTGRIMPVREICQVASSAGIEVLVDGAHGIAQFKFNVEELGCDYYAASLHKWLCGPMGSGVLFVKKDRIEKLWPLYGQYDPSDKTAAKFEAAYTYAMAAHIATEPALDFHKQLGSEVRENLLRSIKDEVKAVVSQFSGVELITPTGEKQSCAMFAAFFKNHDAIQIRQTLMDKYQIAVGGHRNPEGISLRFAPNIYTTSDEIALLAAALKEILN